MESIKIVKDNPENDAALKPSEKLQKLLDKASMTDMEQNLYKLGYMMVKNNAELSKMSAEKRALWIEGFINGNMYRMRREIFMVKNLDPINQEIMLQFFSHFEESMQPKEKK